MLYVQMGSVLLNWRVHFPSEKVEAKVEGRNKIECGAIEGA